MTYNRPSSPVKKCQLPKPLFVYCCSLVSESGSEDIIDLDITTSLKREKPDRQVSSTLQEVRIPTLLVYDRRRERRMCHKKSRKIRLFLCPPAFTLFSLAAFLLLPSFCKNFSCPKGFEEKKRERLTHKIPLSLSRHKKKLKYRQRAYTNYCVWCIEIQKGIGS